MSLVLMFVEAGMTHIREKDYKAGIHALDNARYCRDCSAKLEKELHGIINGLRKEHPDVD